MADPYPRAPQRATGSNILWQQLAPLLTQLSNAPTGAQGQALLAPTTSTTTTTMPPISTEAAGQLMDRRAQAEQQNLSTFEQAYPQQLYQLSGVPTTEAVKGWQRNARSLNRLLRKPDADRMLPMSILGQMLTEGGIRLNDDGSWSTGWPMASHSVMAGRIGELISQWKQQQHLNEAIQQLNSLPNALFSAPPYSMR